MKWTRMRAEDRWSCGGRVVVVAVDVLVVKTLAAAALVVVDQIAAAAEVRIG